MRAHRALTLSITLLLAPAAIAAQGEIWRIGFVFDTPEEPEAGHGGRILEREGNVLTGFLYSGEDEKFQLRVEITESDAVAEIGPADKRLPTVKIGGTYKTFRLSNGECVDQLLFSNDAYFLVMRRGASDIKKCTN